MVYTGTQYTEYQNLSFCIYSGHKCNRRVIVTTGNWFYFDVCMRTMIHSTIDYLSKEKLAGNEIGSRNFVHRRRLHGGDHLHAVIYLGGLQPFFPVTKCVEKILVTMF